MNKFNKEILKLNKKRKNNVALIFISSFLLIFLIIFSATISKKYTLKPGDIAKTSIKATRDVTDKAGTEEKKKLAAQNVGLQYTKDVLVLSDVKQNISSFFDILKSDNMNTTEKINKVKSELSINLARVDFNTLLSMRSAELTLIKTTLNDVLTALYTNMNLEQESTTKKIAAVSLNNGKSYVLNTISTLKLTELERNLIINISNFEIFPNYIYDDSKTKIMQVEAKAKMEPIIIKKDQIVVKEGEPVTADQIQVLKDLGLLNNNKNFDFYINLSLAIIVAIVMLLQWLYVYVYHREIYVDNKKLILMSAITIIGLLMLRTVSIVSVFLVPFALMPLLFSLVFSQKFAIAISALNAVFMSIICGFDQLAMILIILNSIAGAVVIKKMHQRNDILLSAVYLSALNFIIGATTGFLLNNNILEVIGRAAMTIAGSVLAAILTIGFLPFFESVFGIVTIIKLLELSNPNNPLLKRLLLEAPGTYHHSILVANLAEVAAEAVGADGVLTRVSAYYHDVGKLKRPYFFKENQLGKDNPHNKITPNLSALIIISHVKDGYEIAQEYKLPKVIQDIILQHHGTSLVKYFYIMMKNSIENTGDANRSNYLYPGPIPTSKEAGIIMLADSVEAAVRSIKEPTQGKVDEMINNIIKERLHEGQLDNCDLTLKDLDTIHKAFLKSFSGLYHRRIEYPVEKPSGGN